MGRLQQISEPALLTRLDGEIVGTNSSWDRLIKDKLPEPHLKDLRSVQELAGFSRDPVSIEAVETALGQLAVSMLSVDIFDLMIADSETEILLHTSVTPLVDNVGNATGGIGVFQVTTNERQSQERQQHQEKMQAVSRLSAGIAHEFNNLLTAVLGNLEITRAQAPDAVGVYLESAESAALRAIRLMQELRHFGTRTLPGLTVQPIEPVLESTAKVLQGMCPENVIVACQPNTSLPLTASVDANVLQDVLLRIGRNSIEALAGKDGVITISAGVRPSADKPCIVQIEIRDNGPGMLPESGKLAFEPFFTTRSPDTNAGLGLAIVYCIVEELGGEVTIRNAAEGGTAVCLQLPWTELLSVETTTTAETTTAPAYHVGLVDNEPGVRSVGQGMLRLQGHTVTTFGSGPELLEALTNGLQLDLILLDRAMPVMSGRATYQQLRESGFDTPVIVCSGTSVDLQGFSMECDSVPIGFLAKPFTLATPADAVQLAVVHTNN